MIALLGLFLAHAAGVHAGIPVRGVEGLGAPSFLTPASGWSAPVAGGSVRVFVGATEAEGANWYDRQLEALVHPPDPYTLRGADEAHGDGVGLVLFRDGNVGVLVRTTTNAAAVATKLLGAIVETGPSVRARLDVGPDLGEPYGRWQVSAPGAAAIRSSKAGGADLDAIAFSSDPGEIYVWDAYGRVQVLPPR